MVNGVDAHLEDPASLLRSSQLRPGPWVRVGVRMGDPRQLLSRTFGNRHMGSSHWHQDIRVTAAVPGDIAKPFHHVPCKMASLQALVGKHGHPQAEEEAKEGQ